MANQPFTRVQVPAATSDVSSAVDDIYNKLARVPASLTTFNTDLAAVKQEIVALKSSAAKAASIVSAEGGSGSGTSPTSAASVFLFGVHAYRLSLVPNYPVGTFFWETDRLSLYVIVGIGGANYWSFVSGMYSDVFVNRPTDLGSNDAGFLFESTDMTLVERWNGIAWECLTSMFVLPVILIGNTTTPVTPPVSPSGKLATMIVLLIQDGTGNGQPLWDASFAGQPTALIATDPNTFSTMLFISVNVGSGFVWLYCNLNQGVPIP